MPGPRDGTYSRYLGQRFSGLGCGSVQNLLGPMSGLIQIRADLSEARRPIMLTRMKTSEEPMWLMGTPGSLIFIGLVAVMVAVSLKLLA